MDRDLWLNHQASQRREGEMRGGRGALCHVQARTEYLVLSRHGAERRKAITEHEAMRIKEHVLHIHWCEREEFGRQRGLRGAPSPI